MADQKISALSSASLPLVGSEVLPVVQSGTTKKVAVSDLTSGRDVTTKQLIAAAIPIQAGVSGTSATFGTGNSTWDLQIFNNINGGGIGDVTVKFPSGGGLFSVAGTATLEFDTVNNVKFNTGNLIQGTAAKGINFTANTPAAGKTSQLLNAYEEGTWTPTQGAGLTVVGAFSSYGYYTRVGRQVTVFGSISGATSVAANSGQVMCGGLPFAVVVPGVGTANSNTSVTAAASEIYSNANVGATATIIFSCTYFV